MKLKPCIPPEVQAAADAAQERKEQAIERLMSLAVEEDPFIRGLSDLIDADRRVVHMRVHRR